MFKPKMGVATTFWVTDSRFGNHLCDVNGRLWVLVVMIIFHSET